MTTTGKIIERRGQRYEIIEAKPHVRLDGKQTTVYALLTNCKTCGDEFVATVGRTDISNPRRSLTRRCPNCRPKRAPRLGTVRERCPHCGQRMPGVKP